MTDPFLDLLSKYAIPHRTGGQHHHARAGWVQMDCPYCSPGAGRFRLGYSLASRAMNCWSCGPHSVVDAFALLSGLSRERAWSLLKDLKRGPKVVARPVGTLKLPEWRGPLLLQHRRYLQGRGFDPEALVRDWGLEGIGLLTHLKWRVFIPVHLRGRVVSWTTRSISPDARQRYISAGIEEEEISHKQLLYGEDRVPGDSILVVEGPTSVWRLGPGAVCTFGSAYTESQVARISRYRRRGICFDGDEEGQRAAQRLFDALEPLPGETWAYRLVSAMDPAETIHQERAVLLAELHR